MTKVFIIHGSYGNPNENWFPWLKEKLESEGHTVFVPEFPTPENQSLESWMEVFNDFYLSKIDEDTIFVGHSLGPAFILSILEKLNLPKPVKACFFVAGFLGLLGNKDFDEINKTFTTKEFNWKKISDTCEQFYVFHSDNDPYVPLQKANGLANNLKTEVVEIDDAGHFNKEAGYTKFPELLDYIQLSLRQNKISITNNDGEKLVGLCSYPKSKKEKYKAIILAHGFGVTKYESGMFDQINNALNKNDYLVFRFDFSGCGESEGDYSETSLTKLKEDLNSIISYVKSNPEVDKENVGILAQSFGTATTLALMPDVKSIAFTGSIAHPKKIMSQLFEENYNPEGVSRRMSSSGKETLMKSQFWSDADNYNFLENVRKIKADTIFIHGEKDDKVPVSESEELYSQANEPKELKIIKGADHSFWEQRKELLSEIIEWFKKTQ
jgi:hypothetical protein